MSVGYTRIYLLSRGECTAWRVRGTALGRYFVLHKWPEKKLGPVTDGVWRITHKPTGHSLIRRSSRAEALKAWRLAAEMTKQHRLNWSFKDPAAVKSWPKKIRAKFEALTQAVA